MAPLVETAHVSDIFRVMFVPLLFASFLLPHGTSDMATNGAQSQVVAVFVLTRHGDRTANYGNPWNFTEAADELTPLGKTMLYNQGQFIHSVYFDPTSTTMVKNISSIYTMSQVNTLASDNEVILASANAFLQGVFPPTLNSTDPTMTSTLANGTTYYPPLGGYQYVPLNTLPDTNDIALDGWVDCTAMKNGFANFQQSQAWQDKEQQTQSFFNNLTPLLGGRPSNLANVYSIYDYLNYQYTYNSTLAQSLGVDNFLYLKSLANWYEYNTYGGNYDSINTIAGATFASQLYNDINTTISSSTKSPIFTYYADGFQTFISFFDLYNLTDTNPEFQSITEFGSALVFEISTQSTNSVQFSDYMVRMLYKNGTDQGTPLVPYGLFGLNSGAMPLDQFMGNISARSVNNLTSWCSLCGNNFSRGCQNLVVAASCSSDRVSPVGAGFIGAAVAIVVGAIGALLFFLSRRRSFRNTETASVIKMNGIDRD